MRSAQPRILFVGAVLEGRRCLEALIEAGERPIAIVTLDPALAASTSGCVPFDDIAASLDVPLLAVRDLNTEENVELATALRPDLILVIRWTQLLGRAVLGLPPLGAVGFQRCFETPSSTECGAIVGLGPFVPNLSVDVSERLEAKLDAFAMYVSGFVRGRICDRARRSVCSLTATEAFMVARDRW